MNKLIQLTKSSDKGLGENHPKILIIVPQPILEANQMHPEFIDDAISKSQQIPRLYQEIAEKENRLFLDIGKCITSSHIGGVHIDIQSNKVLAKSIADIIKIMGDKF